MPESYQNLLTTLAQEIGLEAVSLIATEEIIIDDLVIGLQLQGEGERAEVVLCSLLAAPEKDRWDEVARALMQANHLCTGISGATLGMLPEDDTVSLNVRRPLHALEAETPRIRYEEVAVEALAERQPASFDVVTCMEMLEHVPDPESVVKACAELVKPGGWVFFSTLNRNVQSFAQAIVAAEYLLNLLPRGTHEYAKMIKPSELAGFCRAAGLNVLHAKGLQHNPITGRYWLSANTSVNYMIAAQRPAQ